MANLLYKKLLFILILAFACIGGSVGVWAKTSDHSKSDLGLTSKQAHSMALALAHELTKNELFNSEFPVKTVLGLFQIQSTPSLITSREFTETILNALLSNVRILVMNQDIALTDTQDFRLQSYENSPLLSLRGVMLGAQYDLQGTLESHTVQYKKQKFKNVYSLHYVMSDIRTHKVLIDKKLTFKHNGKVLKDKQAYGR